jgi:probable phosphoglycerate mutase
MHIFLIRHGETASNAARIVQTPDVPLSRRGLLQAGALARRLRGLGVAAILSSDLRRAAMTAERLGIDSSAAIDLAAELQERNYGDVRGRAYAELGVDILAPNYEPPGGETWAVFHRRVARAWTRIGEAARRAQGNLAVVTHGLVCYSLALHHLKLPAGTDAPLRWANTSLTVIGARPPWDVTVLNCTAHLDEERADDAGAPSTG